MDTKPILKCIIGRHMGNGEYVVKVGEPLTLDQAEYFAHAGWEVILDPQDLEALARWEQLQRSARKPRSWRQWSGRD